VVVVERQPNAYALPRAVHFDDEIGRILQSVEVAPDCRMWSAPTTTCMSGAAPTGGRFCGWTAVTHLDHADGVTLELQSSTDDRKTVAARYVVGADGANNLVRSWIGPTVTDLGYFHDWLVTDLLMLAPLEKFDFTPPAWQLCDPAAPTPSSRGARGRFEFMRLPTSLSQGLEPSAGWPIPFLTGHRANRPRRGGAVLMLHCMTVTRESLERRGGSRHD
jgi:hypothetical protein